ncbi:MAG: hypothetical protein AVDCRST_MAG88-2378, partial [uncultured Thermomicrobiales bacterium]
EGREPTARGVQCESNTFPAAARVRPARRATSSPRQNQV